MGRIDKEQPGFEQITLRNFKKWSNTALKMHSQVGKSFWKLKALLKWPTMLFTLNTLLVLMKLQFLS